MIKKIENSISWKVPFWFNTKFIRESFNRGLKSAKVLSFSPKINRLTSLSTGMAVFQSAWISTMAKITKTFIRGVTFQWRYHSVRDCTLNCPLLLWTKVSRLWREIAVPHLPLTTKKWTGSGMNLFTKGRFSLTTAQTSNESKMNKRIKFPLLVPCSITFSSVSVEHRSHSVMYSFGGLS